MILDFASSDQWITSVTYETPEEGLEWPALQICGIIWPGLSYLDGDLPLDDSDAVRILLGRNEAEAAKTVMEYGNQAFLEDDFPSLARKYDDPEFDKVYLLSLLRA